MSNGSNGQGNNGRPDDRRAVRPREFFAWLISLGQAIAFLTHFIMIAVYGGLRIQEPNRVILSLEIVAVSAVVLVSLYFVVKSFKRR